MMIVMKSTATEDEIQAVIERIESCGARAHPSRGEEVTVIGAIGDREHVARLGLEGAPGVEQVVPILKPYKLSSRQLKGDERTRDRDRRAPHRRRPLRAHRRPVHGRVARPDAHRRAARRGRRREPVPRRRLQAAHLALLLPGPRPGGPAAAGGGRGARPGLPIVTELMDARDVEPVLEVADVIQVGARNMQNYALLAEIGRTGRPVLLKRGLSATLEELLMAAEYVLKEGNPNVMLCERGIRTFETAYRFTLDLTAVPVLKELSAPARHRGPEPRRRAPLARRAALARRRGGGRRRHHRRGPPAARRGDLRRPAAAARGRLRGVRREGRARRGDRRQGAVEQRRGPSQARCGSPSSASG